MLANVKAILFDRFVIDAVRSTRTSNTNAAYRVPPDASTLCNVVRPTTSCLNSCANRGQSVHVMCRETGCPSMQLHCRGYSLHS